MASVFFNAPEVDAIVADLIDRHERRLQRARIRCLFTTVEKKVDGHPVVAWTKKLDPVAQYLSGTPRTDEGEPEQEDAADYALIVDVEKWSRFQDDDVKRRYVHHELMRMCGYPGKWALVDHDFQGFYREYSLYGAWRFELREIADLVQQQALPLDAVTS